MNEIVIRVSITVHSPRSNDLKTTEINQEIKQANSKTRGMGDRMLGMKNDRSLFNASREFCYHVPKILLLTQP